MEKQSSRETLSADDLMKVSWKMFKERFLKFLYIFLLSIVCVLFMGTVFLALALFQGSNTAILLALLVVFCAILLIAMVQNLMFLEVVRNKNVRIRQALRRAIPKVRPYAGSLAFYLLVASNLIVLFIFLSLFVVMAGAFISIISYMQSVSVIFGMLVAFLIFFVSLILTVCAIYAYTWQYFLFFDVIMHGMPVRESLDHSFYLINKNKRDIFEKAGSFLLFFVLTLLTLTVISTFTPGLGFIVEAGNYVLAGWAVVYLYAMFEDIKAANPGNASAADRQSVSLLVKSGSVIVLTVILLMCFSVALTITQLEYSYSGPVATQPDPQVVTSVDSL